MLPAPNLADIRKPGFLEGFLDFPEGIGVAAFGGHVEGLVPPTVAKALKERLADER